MTRLEAEFLSLCKAETLTNAEVSELGKWWRRYLRQWLTSHEKLAPLVRDVIHGKADADDHARRVVHAVQTNRALIIETAIRFVDRPEFAEFRADFEAIAARAEALL